MKDMFSGSGPFEMGAWAATGWGFLTPAPREPRDVRVKGFARTGWGQLAAIPEEPPALPLQQSKVLFGQRLSGKEHAMRGKQNPFIGGTIEQTFGGGYIHPVGNLQAEASPYGQFGQGFPQGGLQGPVPQQVPVVQGQVMYTVRQGSVGGKKNPNWPLQGPRHGQMWLQ